MTLPNILAATWSDGLFVFADETRGQELAGRSVRALSPDSRGGALAIVDGHALCRRTSAGAWSTLATSELDLACVLAVGAAIYLGTNDARVFRCDPDGKLEQQGGFEAVPGRDKWYAGSALINGRRVGPPLGVRSMSATADGVALLANVHVGGIPRSIDGGATWQPTIDIDSDVHEVCGHPLDSRMVIAAAAVGLCISADGGATWTVEREGLHATYCSAVAFSQAEMLVAASTDHFATRGAVYRRPMHGKGPLERVPGLPWLEGIVDTGCIAASGSAIVIADKGGNLYLSTDAGRTWLQRDQGLPMISKILLI